MCVHIAKPVLQIEFCLGPINLLQLSIGYSSLRKQNDSNDTHRSFIENKQPRQVPSRARGKVSESLDVSLCQMPQCQPLSHLSSLNFIICSFPVFHSQFARTFVHR